MIEIKKNEKLFGIKLIAVVNGIAAILDYASYRAYVAYSG
jgi:hypothetical protein